MENPGIVIVAVLALAALYVLVPRVAHVLAWYRQSWSLPCPEAGKQADVTVDAARAAFTSAFGRPLLRARGCSLWPARMNCAEGCLHAPKVETP